MIFDSLEPFSKGNFLFLDADSRSISPNVVVCCLLFVVYQVEKLLANCSLTAC